MTNTASTAIRPNSTQGDRIDWPAVRDRIDLAPIATALLGPAPGRRGERGRRLWWRCPFHDDPNPSWMVDPGKPWWRCYGCGAHGDVVDLVMRLRGAGFREAVEWIADQTGLAIPARERVQKYVSPRTREAPGPLAALRSKTSAPRVMDHFGPSGRKSQPTSHKGFAEATQGPKPLLDLRTHRQPENAFTADAIAAVIDEAAGRLWEPAGAEALAYLVGRGLEPETIRAARLGYADRLRVPRRDGSGTWPLSGVVVPWLDRGRPELVKVRRLGLVRGAKYIEVYRGRPVLYPDPAAVRPGSDVIVCEGEFDAILLRQELAHLPVGVVTLGGASNQPPADAVDLLCQAGRLFIATDGDEAGNAAADRWPAHARRIRPPGAKDWTDLHAAGRNLIRYWWPGYLCGFRWPAAICDDQPIPETTP